MPTYPASVPASNDALTAYLTNFSGHAVLRHCLGLASLPNPHEMLKHAVAIMLDCESFEQDHSKLTEIGLAVFTVSSTKSVTCPGDHGENLLKTVSNYHWRIIENAHLINRRFCPGDPTRNHFGRTSFLTLAEAKRALTRTFNRPVDPIRPELGMSPIIFLGHAMKGDESELRATLGLDASVFQNVVKRIDTQHMASELGLAKPRQQIGLKSLCQIHGFEFCDSHTAGNDAAYQLITAVLMAIGKSDGISCGKTTQGVVDAVMKWSQEHADTSFGVAKFCERCGKSGHLRKQCRKPVLCKKCQNAGRGKAMKTHVTERCFWK